MRLFRFTLIALLLGAASLCVAQEPNQLTQGTKADSSAKPPVVAAKPEEPKGEVALVLEELKKRGKAPVIMVGTSSEEPEDKTTRDVINGKALKLVQPEYPRIAWSARVSGQVVVLVIIDTEGKVIAAEALSGHPLLFGASLKAAKASEFTGTKLDGKPVYIMGKIIYNFLAQ